MAETNFSKKRNIPSLTTRKSSPMTTNFAKGIYTYKPNDTMGLDELRLAQDARFDRVGEYGTRLGYKKLSEPIGKTTLSSNVAEGPETTPAADVQPYTYTASADSPIYSVKVQLAKVTENYVVPKIILAVDGEYVTSSCIDDKQLTDELAEYEVIFTNTPSLYNGEQLEVTIGVQSGELSDFEVATAADNVLMCEVDTATPGEVTNVFEANIDGDRSVLFTFNGTLYWQNSSGTVASIRTLPVGVQKVRFSQNINTIRYADGVEVPHLLTPTVTSGVVTAWADTPITPTDLETETTLNVTMSNIMAGPNDNIIYFATDPNTEALWTYPYGYEYAKSAAFTTTGTIQGNVGDVGYVALNTVSPSGIQIGDWITGQGTSTAEVTDINQYDFVWYRIVDATPQAISSYDKFSTTFYQNFPAIKTGDPLTAMFNLGGVVYIQTRRNKYQMYMQTAESWSQSPSNAQGGTFSQESVVCDLNYAYYANENGIYIFDGASEASLTENTIQNVYDAIPNKENIVLDLYKNRLYVYFPSEADGANDSCLVYNINLKVWESFDSNTYVSATSARQNSSSRFICGHSKVGMLMLNENVQNNDYSDMGEPIAFNLETSYQHYGTTSQLKRITKWRPQFSTTAQPYTCECGYALDYTDQVQYAFSIDLQRQEFVNANYVWDNPSDYGVPSSPTVYTTIPLVNGEFYRCQIRYQHIAAFEPVIFRSHTLTVQTQRIR